MNLYCNEIYTEKGCISGVLHIENGVFKEIRQCPHEQRGKISFDASDYRLLPGIIDIHTHGFMSFSSQSDCVENYRNLSTVMASHGVSAFLVTAGEHNEKELQGLSAIADAIEQGVPGAKILGIHMEGPFLNKEKKGAFMEEQLLPIDIDCMKTFIQAARNHIRYVAISPELDPDSTFLSFLKQQKILVAGGHTTATYREYSNAIAHGLDASTHTGNAMNQLDRREVHALGAALLSPTLYNEVICDCIHIAPEMLTIYTRVKDKRKLLMISDSGQLAGLPPGTYKIHNQIRHVKDDGRILLDDGGIAGSSKSILWGIQCLEQTLHLPMEDIVPMFSLNQACFLGLEEHMGSIEVGKDADFMLVDKDYNVIATYVKGICVYQINTTHLPTQYECIEKIDDASTRL